MINMKKYLFFLGMALVALIFSSCNGKKGVFTPTSSGRAYEILVVVDTYGWAGFAAIEAIALYCLVVALVMLSK